MTKPELIYREARALPREGWSAYLDRACAGEPVLRARVEQMLAMSEEGKAAMAGPPHDESERRPPAGESAKPPGVQPNGVNDDFIGQKIGPYKIVERIGEGGFGAVYVAEQTEPLRRLVALKVIKLGMDTKQVVTRFGAERHALALMDHPNIARVLDAGATETGRPYFVMELVRGVRITDYCDQNNLSTAERLGVFVKVCQTIQHAHQKGIIHRDIKPSNILVTLQDGVPVPKVIDFGIAKATEGRLTEATVDTQLHHFIGTPAYMSPEQAEMGGLDIDTRSDIYSLGVLLYELLASRPPFDPGDLSVLGIDALRRTIRELVPARPSARVATLKGEALATAARRRSVDSSRLIHQLKGDLDWIVMKCLEKDRSRRYETASGIAADIQRHLNHQPVTAGRPGTIYVLKKFVGRHRWPVLFAATATVLVCVGLIGTTIGLERATAARGLADQNAARATLLAGQARQAEAAALQEKTLALRLAYSASMLAACDAVQNAQVDAERHYLDNAPADERGWEWRLLSSRLDLSVCFQKRARPSGARLHLLPDGRSYYDVVTNRIERWDCESGRLLATLHTDRACANSWLVAGGKRMFLQVADEPLHQQDMECWDLERGTRLAEWLVPNDSVPTPDGLRVAGPSGTNILMLDAPATLAQSAARMIAQTAVGSEPRLICFQADGRRFAVAQPMGNVALLDTDPLAVRSAFRPHENLVQCMEFSPDSRWLATGSIDKTVRITDVSVNPPVTVSTLRGHTDWLQGVSFSPDGKLLASSGQDGTWRLWDTRTGVCRGVFKSAGDCPRFLPDGRTLMEGGPDGVRFWDVPALDAWVLRGHESYVYSVLISPDGGTIYSAGWDGFAGHPGSVRFWDAATGEPIGDWGTAGEYVRTAGLSPDGTRLAASIFFADRAGGRIEILDTATGTTLLAITNLGPSQISGALDSLAFDPSGRCLACVDETQDAVVIIDSETGVRLKSRRIPREAAGGMASTVNYRGLVAWSPDGGTIAVWLRDATTINLLDGHSLDPLRQWPHGHAGGVTSASFSPDSRRILTTSPDGIVRVWDAATGALVHDLVGHANRVLCAAYSPDGERIASGGFDNNVLIWNAHSFEQVARLGGHQDYIHSLAWRADSQELVSGSGDRTIRIWDTQPLKERVKARGDRKSILAEVEPIVRGHFAELGDAGKVVERLKADDSLTGRARQVALQVALGISLERIKRPSGQFSAENQIGEQGGRRMKK